MVVLSGLSGSGKSTYAQKLAEREVVGQVVKVSADDFFYDNGEYRFDASKLSLAHGACFKKFIEHVRFDMSLIIVDNTNLSAEEIAPYMLGAQAYGYEAEIITLDIPMLFAHQRNVHGVSEKGVENQWVRLCSRKLPPWWKNTVVKSEGFELATAVGD